MPGLVYWQKFDPEQFDFEFEEEELAGHDVSVDEAVEVLWNGFQVDRNKGHRPGYQLIGCTDAGRTTEADRFREEKEPPSRYHRWNV